MNIFLEIKKINHFILNPKHDTEISSLKKNKWSTLTVCIIYKIIFAVLLGLPITYLLETFVFTIEKKQEVDKTTFFEFFINVVILAPIIEELIFRLPLKFGSNPLFFFDTKKGLIEKNWRRYFKYIFYTLSLGFSLIHISNFKIDNYSLLFYLLAPLFVLSQLFSGLIYGYIRMNLGFSWSVLSHSIYNLIFAFILGVSSYDNLIIKKYDKSFNLEIFQLSFYKNNELKQIEFNEESLTKIQWNDEGLQKLLDTIYNKKYQTYDNQLIKLDLTTTQPLPKEEFLTILREKYRIVEKDSLKK